MKISAKAVYACIAVMELAARQGSTEPVRIRYIAERHKVPPRFLVQILLQLKGADIVESTRGAAGGYRLKKKPDEVTLGQVINIIEPPLDPKEREDKLRKSSLAASFFIKVWDGVEQRRQDFLELITFDDLMRQYENGEHGIGEILKKVAKDTVE